MKKMRTGKNTKILLAIGLFLILITLFFNERIIAALFPDYHIAVTYELKLGIFVADALFAIIAIFMLTQQKSKFEILVDILVGFGFTLLVLTGIEVGFYFLNNSQDDRPQEIILDFIKGGETANVQFKDEHNRALFQRDEWLGYKLTSNTEVIASRAKAGKTLYHVIYSTDSYGRRITPIENPETVHNHILFFGGSYTFGEGVNNNETMPYYVSQLAPEYRAYNYGASGYGPQHMLAKLQTDDVAEEIQEAQGLLIYTFIVEHIGRAIGSMWIHSQRGDVMPYYFINTDGNLIRNGNFVSGRRGLSFLYSIASKSQTLEYFGIDFPLQTGDKQLKTFTKIIEESRHIYRDKFNSDRFYVLIYPTLGYPELIPYLEAADINYLDYSNLPQAYEPGFWLGEGHPTAKAHRIVAEKLVGDLDLAD